MMGPPRRRRAMVFSPPPTDIGKRDLDDGTAAQAALLVAGRGIWRCGRRRLLADSRHARPSNDRVTNRGCDTTDVCLTLKSGWPCMRAHGPLFGRSASSCSVQRVQGLVHGMRKNGIQDVPDAVLIETTVTSRLPQTPFSMHRLQTAPHPWPFSPPRPCRRTRG